MRLEQRAPESAPTSLLEAGGASWGFLPHSAVLICPYVTGPWRARTVLPMPEPWGPVMSVGQMKHCPNPVVHSQLLLLFLWLMVWSYEGASVSLREVGFQEPRDRGGAVFMREAEKAHCHLSCSFNP